MGISRKTRKGYTLLELLFTVMLIGVLVSLALPRMSRLIEYGRIAEAKTILSSIRDAQVRYMIRNEHFTNNLAELDAPPVGLKYFTLNLAGVDTSIANATVDTTVVANCTRNGVDNTAGFAAGYDVFINRLGAISSSDANVRDKLI